MDAVVGAGFLAIFFVLIGAILVAYVWKGEDDDAL